MDQNNHASYPHWPGQPYDCDRCVNTCYCWGEEGLEKCVHCTLKEELEGEGQRDVARD